MYNSAIKDESIVKLSGAVEVLKNGSRYIAVNADAAQLLPMDEVSLLIARQIEQPKTLKQLKEKFSFLQPKRIEFFIMDLHNKKMAEINCFGGFAPAMDFAKTLDAQVFFIELARENRFINRGILDGIINAIIGAIKLSAYAVRLFVPCIDLFGDDLLDCLRLLKEKKAGKESANPYAIIHLETDASFFNLPREAVQEITGHGCLIKISLPFESLTREDLTKKIASLTREAQPSSGRINCEIAIDKPGQIDKSFEITCALGIKNLSFEIAPKLAAAGYDCAPEFLRVFCKAQACLRFTDSTKITVNPIDDIVINILNTARFDICRRNPCGAGVNLLAFDIEGDIFPCDRLLGIAAWKLGSITQIRDSACNFEDNSALKMLKERTIQNIPRCKSCVWRNFCCGGCAARVITAGQALLSEDTLCGMYKNLYPNLAFEIFNNRYGPDFLKSENREYSPC